MGGMMTIEEYCESREGCVWSDEDTEFVAERVRRINRLAEQCIAKAMKGGDSNPVALATIYVNSARRTVEEE